MSRNPVFDPLLYTVEFQVHLKSSSSSRRAPMVGTLHFSRKCYDGRCRLDFAYDKEGPTEDFVAQVVHCELDLVLDRAPGELGF